MTCSSWRYWFNSALSSADKPSVFWLRVSSDTRVTVTALEAEKPACSTGVRIAGNELDELVICRCHDTRSSGSLGIISASLRTMSSGLMPSASALKLVMMRCRNTGAATARMSSHDT